MEIRRATRQGVRPLIDLFGESGCGKTYSSLLLARGFVGPNGKICMIDTESGRGELYADVLPGGYDVLPLQPPFSPVRYVEALNAASAAGYAIVVVDSGSHEWEGAGGVLDMAAANEERSGKSGLHNWKTPKMEHAKFVLALLQSPLPVICCLRAKFKTRQAKIDGKTSIVKDDFTSPIQSDEFIFESTMHGEIMPDHSLRVTKCSHPELRKCFPDGKPITVEHGERLAAWCAAPNGKRDCSPAPAPSAAGRPAKVKEQIAALRPGDPPATITGKVDRCWKPKGKKHRVTFMGDAAHYISDAGFAVGDEVTCQVLAKETDGGEVYYEITEHQPF